MMTASGKSVEGHHISGDDVMLVVVPPEPKGPGYSAREIDDVLNTPVTRPDNGGNADG